MVLKMVDILIKDECSLYHHSVKLFCIDFFNGECEEVVNFLEGYESENIARADVIIYALCKGEHFTCFSELKLARRVVIIGITTDEEPSPSFLPNCLKDAFFVSRSASLSHLKKIFRKAWNAHSLSLDSGVTKLCEGCKHKILSKRELSIMACIYKGQSTSHIAKEMVLGHKTVYAHKYSVMKKFNLRSEHELLELLNRLLKKRCTPNFFRDAIEQIR